MSRDVKPLKNEGNQRQIVVAGAVAGLVSRFVIAPLDVIKIRLQLQTHSLSDPLSHNGIIGPVYKGTYRTFRSILREEGITAFWKGNVPAELLYLTYGAIQFLTYTSTTRALNSIHAPNSLSTTPNPKPLLPQTLINFLAGATAGTLATSATYPLDLLRTRFAAQGSERIYSSLIASVRDIGRHEGFKGFFRGLSAGVGQIVPYMGLFFAFYEGLKPPLSIMSSRLPAILPWNKGTGASDAAAGILASVFSKTAVFPLDTVRKRLQVQGPMRSRYVHRNIPEYQGGVVRTARTIVAREGVRGLYRGLGVALVKAAPAGAVTVWTYERVMGALLEWEEGNDTQTT
ncbi:mitochondrial thiamine pyrophosphate carrier 1 [Rhizodiscina lignyota]|uniref:Mitochondrial thiamine pyrophosphate carrier 1 n=1 Tax=Rhizodiscina lignyota TaxID=1504668 RepID=A0A9P4IJI9_9PEZI|nr:mitochondrial thiamine pyrophosphate carrier 1 [Rhizodiscina lignyota]